MSDIPSEIYQRVHELALAITNASEAGDEILSASCCLALRALFDELTASGRCHPFLTEAVADYTDDLAEAVRLYELALQQSRQFPDEPRHTKMISLAELLLELGRREQAEAYLHDGRAEALRRGDTFWIEDADRLLHELDA
jgi:hypothetical protein